MSKSIKAETVRLVGYARMSTNLQSETTIAAQSEKMEQYCKYAGHELVNIYKDEAISGKEMHTRPGLQQAIKACLDGEADGLVVTYMDRLSRNTRQFLELVEKFEKAGKRLIFLDLNVDTSGPTGKCVMTVLMAMAQMQRESASERSKASRQSLKLAGKSYSGSTPYGFKRSDVVNPDGTKDLIPDADEQQTLELIKKLVNQGKTGSAICAHLNATGIKARSGNDWGRKTVYNILERLEL